MIIEVKRRTHVQRMTYDDFERRIRDGEIPPETLVRFDVVTGDRFLPAGSLELYRELMAPDRLAFRKGLSQRGLPILTALLVGVQLRIWIWSHAPHRARWIQGHLSNNGPAVTEQGEFWRLITYGFVQVDFTHLLFNLCFLGYTAYHLERAIGRLNLALIFLHSVVFGGVLSMVFAPLPPSIGSSGGVFGLIAATVVLGWKHWDDIPERARRYFGWALLPYLVLSGVSGMSNEGVDNWSHFGGLVAGGLLMTVLEPEALSSRRGSNRVWRTVAVAALVLMIGTVHQLGTRLVPLEQDSDERGIVVSRPTYWGTGWHHTGARGWQTGEARASVARATITQGHPTSLEDAVDELVKQVGDGARDVEVLGRESVDVQGVPGVRLRMRFIYDDAVQTSESLVVVRGVFVHRLSFRVKEGLRERYVPLMERIFASFQLTPLDELRRAERRARQHPRSWEPQVDLGKARYRTGDPRGALESFETALSLSRDEPEALLGIVETVHYYGLPDGAARARTALSRAGDDPRIIVAAAALLEAVGQREEAVEVLDAAWRMLPGDRRIRRARGRMGLSVELPRPQ